MTDSPPDTYAIGPLIATWNPFGEPRSELQILEYFLRMGEDKYMYGADPEGLEAYTYGETMSDSATLLLDRFRDGLSVILTRLELDNLLEILELMGQYADDNHYADDTEENDTETRTYAECWKGVYSVLFATRYPGKLKPAGIPTVINVRRDADGTFHSALI